MEKLEVEMACGCRKITVPPKSIKLDQLIEWYKSTHCYDCKAKKVAEESKAAGLPALKGTERQIAWAEAIRHEALNSVKNAFAESNLSHPAAIQKSEEVIQYLENKSSARYWIENRTRGVVSWIEAATEFLQSGYEGIHVKDIITHILK